MKIFVPNGKRYALLALLFLLGCGAFAIMSMSGSGPGQGSRADARPGFSWIGRQIVEAPIYSFLPRNFLNKLAVPISREHNVSMLENVFEVFDPSLRSFLASVPIILDSSAKTAKAYPAKGYIGVNPDWDNTVMQSKYRAIYGHRGMQAEDPVFIHRFKTDLLIHEYLHILQVHQSIDSHLFYESVARWYADPRYGKPNPDGTDITDKPKDQRSPQLAANRMKYLLWYQLYNYRSMDDIPQDGSWENMQYVDRYKSSGRGVEEFAYIGQEILSSGSGSENFIKTGQWSNSDWENKKVRLSEVSPEVMAFFRGVFNPALEL